ncbi:hypothetical protein V8F20_000516 [Naviculisporaceae sp. PSN 640]
MAGDSSPCRPTADPPAPLFGADQDCKSKDSHFVTPPPPSTFPRRSVTELDRSVSLLSIFSGNFLTELGCSLRVNNPPQPLPPTTATGEFYIFYPNLPVPPTSTRAANRMGRVMPGTRHTLTVPDTTEDHPGGSSSHTLTVTGNQTEDHQGGTSRHTLTVPGNNENEDHQRASSHHDNDVPEMDKNDHDEPAPTRQRASLGNNENEHDQPTSSRHAGVIPSHGQVPRSITAYINPLAMHPPNVVAATTQPLPAGPRNVDTSHQETRPTRQLDPDEINRKIQEMFAETARLKGQKPQANPRGVPSSKTSIFSKPKVMLKRVTTAVGERLLGSSSSKDQSNKPKQEASVPMHERRLNEGANLNRKKVQDLTGGKQVRRKPVAGQQMSTRKEELEDEALEDDEWSGEEKISAEEPRGRTRFREEPQGHGQSMEDPFSGHSPADRPQPEFERRLRTRSLPMSATPQPQQNDPFAEEGILQSDTNSPLDIAPEAASTPRAPGFRTVRPLSESPTKRAARGRGGPDDPTTNGAPGWI